MCRTKLTVIVLSLIAFVAPHARAASPEDVDAAIARAKEFIYKQQKGDNFEDQKMKEPWVQTGGHTALAVYALLASGESHQDPRLAKAIDYLKKTESKGIYAVGVRCLVWNALPQTDDVNYREYGRSSSSSSQSLRAAASAQVSAVIRRSASAHGIMRARTPESAWTASSQPGLWPITITVSTSEGCSQSTARISSMPMR
jgi:hypothetical protein